MVWTDGGWIAPRGFRPLPAPDPDPGAAGCCCLRRLGYRRAALAAGAGLGVMTVAATVFARLLGPLAIAVWAVLLSLPVWSVWRWLARAGREGSG